MTQVQGSILVVDDEQLNLDMLSRRLRRSGFFVEVASSGRRALEMAHEKPFDLILLDQMMPEVSGEDVLRQLRNDFTAQALPIVMVTAVAESDKIATAIEAGANDYITKPVDYQVALARIRSHLTRKRAGDALRQSEERYALAAKATREGLWDWNLITGEVYFSPRWLEMLGLEDQDVEGRLGGPMDSRAEGRMGGNIEEWFSRILAEDRAAVIDTFETHRAGHATLLQCSYRMLDSRGALRWMSCHGVITRDKEERAIRIAGSQVDITEEKTRDALTGMPNRLRIVGDIRSAIELRNNSGRASTHAVLLLDLDGFKSVNDSMGRAAGDQLLIGVARRLQALTRDCRGTYYNAAQPLAVRMGSDEFAILVRDASTPGILEKLAETIQEAVKSPFDLLGHTLHCAFNIGGAVALGSHSRPEDILRDADIAMYIAKRKGRGEFAIFEGRMGDEAVQQLDLENDIRLAVERDELEVFYQPKVNLDTAQTYGVEALLRWNHPTRGFLQPGSFIPTAEDTGAIVGIGKWIRGRACSQVRAWHALFPMRPPLELSINLSPREFKQHDLVEEIRNTLIETGFPPSSLHLEITEGSLFEDLPAARMTLHGLKALGISLDIDDFGSGYSSLSYLQELPFDLLKIDRYFTSSLDPETPASSRLIESILAMARNLGLQVVAEGIETEEHSHTLQELGCLLGQGYLYSKPIDAVAMQAFLSSERKQADSSASVAPDAVLPDVVVPSGFMNQAVAVKDARIATPAAFVR